MEGALPHPNKPSLLSFLRNYFSPLLFLVAVACAQTQLRPGTYGDRCSLTNPCIQDANLVCINNFCQCSSSDQIFDDVRERCAIQPGKRCKPPAYQYGEFNPCVANAYCLSDKKVCSCAKYAFANEKGRCVKKRHFNETCLTDRHCDDSKYLSCVDGHCQCESPGTFDDYYHICKRRVGDFCLRTRDCVKNSECRDSKCVCNERYVESSDKTCALSYNQKCGGSTQQENEFPCADTYFACINGVCQCKNPSYEMYDKRSRSCLSLVGGLCHLFMSPDRQPVRLKNCVPNAECIRREFSALSQCECEKGFVESVSGTCQLPYGSQCENHTDIADPLISQCDETVPLVCRNSRCDCQHDSDVYIPLDKTCRRSVGSTCTPSSAPCVPNAECDSGRCRCSRGFQPSIRGICEEDSRDNQILGDNFFPVISSPAPPYYTMYRTTPLFE